MNPFEINVADLRRARAAERNITVAGRVDWGLELSKIEPTPDANDNLTAALTLTPISGGLLVHGIANIDVRHTCHRCLEEWTEQLEVPISAMYTVGSSGDDDETFPLGDTIDLEPALRDDVLLAMPLSPTCPDGCDPELVDMLQKRLNTTAPAEEFSAEGIPEDLSDEGSPFSVLRDLLGPSN